MLRQDGEYKINSFSENETKNGDLMAKIQLLDLVTNEKHNCIIWEDSLGRIEKKALKVGNIIAVTNKDYNEKFNNTIIKQVKLIKEASVGISEEKREELFINILEIIEKFSCKKLKTETSNIILKHAEAFKTSPAAKTHHHNYVGGLLVHITECINFSKSIFPVTPCSVNHELVLAGCIMHDFGKVFEYKIDLETGIADFDENWSKTWINHIHWGFSWANQLGFEELAHIIASHHGIKEHGSLVEPFTKEADLVHQVDMLSSRLGVTNVELLEKIER